MKIKSNLFSMRIRDALIAFFIIMLPVSLFLETTYHMVSIAYFDEILGIISAIYLIVLLIKNKMNGKEFLILGLVTLCAIFALIGNIKYKIIEAWFPIAVDFLSLYKIFLPFIFAKYIAETDENMQIIRFLVPAAKFLILSGAFLATVSQFVDIGMSQSERYGLNAFSYVFFRADRYGYIIACCFLAVLLTEKSKTKELIYSIASIYNMLLTTKGVVYVVVACYFVFLFLWKRKKQLTTLQTIPLALVGTVVSTYQINTYLKNLESPRVRFMKYGFRTASRFFPFGSGFATYGSDMAARNYSKLYYQYKFYKYHGLSPKRGSYLNDSYSGMVIGQFGYLGTLFFICAMIVILKMINEIQSDKRSKALALGIFIGLMISCVGTAIIKSSIGVMVMVMLGLMCGYSKNYKPKEYDDYTLNIHF